MFCRYCGAEIPDGSRFCIRCGAVLTEENGGAMSGASENKGLRDSARDAGGTEQGPSYGQQSQGPENGQQGRDLYDHQQTQNQNYGQQEPYMDAGPRQPGSASGGGGAKKGPASSFAIAGLVLGIIGIATACIPIVCLILGALGLILSVVAKTRGDKSGIQTGGMVCSVIAVVLGVIVLIFNIAPGDSGETSEVSEETEESAETEEEEAAESEEEDDAEEGEESADGAGEESAEPEEPEITFENLTVLDNDDISIIIMGIEEDDDWGFTLDVEIENKTSDRTFNVGIDRAYVNGVKTSLWFYEDVSGGNKAVAEADFTDDELWQQGVEEMTDIEIIFTVSDADTWLYVYTETVNVYPYGEEYATVFERESKDSDIVLVDNDSVTVTVTGYEYDDLWGDYEIDVCCVNKSDKILHFGIDEAAIDGYMVSESWAMELDPGMCGFDTIDLYDIDDNIDMDSGVESIELILYAYDESYYTDYIDETVTFNP